MSDDYPWNKDDPSQPGDSNPSDDWSSSPEDDSQLPPPGQGWDSMDKDPILESGQPSFGEPDEGFHYKQGPGGGPPGGPMGPPPGGAPPGGAPPGGPPAGGPPGGAPAGGPPPGGPPSGGPPGNYGHIGNQQGGGGPMMQAPQTGMQTGSQLDNNDIAAIVLSVLIPGVGHIILGQTGKGIAVLAATFLTCGLGYLAFFLVAIDAYMVAMAQKKRQVGDWEFFPQ